MEAQNNSNAEEPLKVYTGRIVDLDLVDEQSSVESMTVQIVPDEFADITKGFLGEATPLAKAVLEHSAGEAIAYGLGDIRSIRIRDVREAQSGPDQSVAERREEKLRKAVNQSDLTNAVLFASSFNSKWGDYDPSSMSNELDQDP